MAPQPTGIKKPQRSPPLSNEGVIEVYETWHDPEKY